jgi:DNA-directed RNA polymerase beta subunit
MAWSSRARCCKTGDPIIAGVRPSRITGDAALLGRLSKSLVKPFEEIVDVWKHDRPGTVVDVAKTGERVAASIRTQEGLQIGDKLSNRYGGKGVIAHIVPDNEMIRDEHDRPVDLLFTSAGVVSRINPAQIIETALGKVAEKTGKPIVVPQYETGRDGVARRQEDAPGARPEGQRNGVRSGHREEHSQRRGRQELHPQAVQDHRLELGRARRRALRLQPTASPRR